MDPENFLVVKNYRKSGNILLPLSHVAVVSALIGKRKLTKFSWLILLIYDSKEESRVKCEAHLAVLYFADDI